MSQIKNYSLVIEHSPEELVKTVTKACLEGFQPVGGVSVAREPANPNKRVIVDRLVYAQAMVRLYTAADALGIVTGGPRGVNGG